MLALWSFASRRRKLPEALIVLDSRQPSMLCGPLRRLLNRRVRLLKRRDRRGAEIRGESPLRLSQFC